VAVKVDSSFGLHPGCASVCACFWRMSEALEAPVLPSNYALFGNEPNAVF